MKLTQEALGRIRGFVLRNGRPLEAAQWRFHFEGGGAPDVLRALEPYQNPDGGFGHAVEPDLWNPQSTPYATLHAATLLRAAGGANGPALQGILRYFRSESAFENGRWLFTVPSNDLAPHAPWWRFDTETNALESPGLTASVAAFLLDVAEPGDSLYALAAGIAKQTRLRLLQGDAKGEMFLDACLALLPHWARLCAPEEVQAARARMKALVRKAVSHDPSEWAGYVPRPSRYIHSPESPFFSDNRAAVEQELDYLLQTLPEDDVWPINWSWFQNGDAYPKAFAIAENWAKASVSLDKLLFLRSFGRMA